jgi:hypothetical protein
MRLIKGRPAQRRFKKLAKNVSATPSGGIAGWIPAGLNDEHITDFLVAGAQNKIEPADAMDALTTAQRKKSGAAGGESGYKLTGKPLALAELYYSSDCDGLTQDAALLHIFTRLVEFSERPSAASVAWSDFEQWALDESNTDKPARIIALMIRSLKP